MVQNSSMASCGACCFFWGRVDGGGEGGGAILIGTIRLEPRRPNGGGEMDAERLTMETDLGGGERERRRRPMRGPRMADMLAVCRCGGRNDRCSAMNHGLLPSDKWERSCLRQTCSRQGAPGPLLPCWSCQMKMERRRLRPVSSAALEAQCVINPITEPRRSSVTSKRKENRTRRRQFLSSATHRLSPRDRVQRQPAAFLYLHGRPRI